jgi:hypothetical protein
MPTTEVVLTPMILLKMKNVANSVLNNEEKYNIAHSA